MTGVEGDEHFELTLVLTAMNGKDRIMAQVR
jgi:hypothetical protein